MALLGQSFFFHISFWKTCFYICPSGCNKPQKWDSFSFHVLPFTILPISQIRIFLLYAWTIRFGRFWVCIPNPITPQLSYQFRWYLKKIEDLFMKNNFAEFQGYLSLGFSLRELRTRVDIFIGNVIIGVILVC